MKVTLVQQDIVWADPLANLRKMEEVLSSVPGSDLYVFPEMFSTGFATSPEGIAESAPAVSLSRMKELASGYDAAIAGSVALFEDGHYYNRFYFVKPDGSVISYDKKHLFTFGGEHRSFSGGDRRVTVEWRGFRFLLLVCYDLRFPVWSRSRGDYDAIIYVASWPDVRRKAWDALLKARSIENQCFVLGVNRVGADLSCRYDGGTVVLDPYGQTLASCPDMEEATVSCELDMPALEAFRKKFPVLEDADKFELI